MRVKFTDKEQMDLVESQALADSAEDNVFEAVNRLLFSGDYRIEGGIVNPDSPVSGVTKIDPGVFVKAGGKFYTMPTTATANILTGVENQSANVWGTGLAAHASLPRKDIIVITFQQVESVATVKNFINDSVYPPVIYTQTVNTRKTPSPLISVLHGTPSATPAEPALPSGFMKLATVNVAATATVINSGDIINNLNINLKTLEKIQLASQAQSAFSDLLHSNGVYKNVNGELLVVETSPQSMGVSVSTGVALRAGTTANVNTATTVPIDGASFAHKTNEVVSFAAGDTQTLQCDGFPPHKIRPTTYVIQPVGGGTPYVESVDYSIVLATGALTRIGGGGIAPGGSVWASYDYYLPRIDVVEVLMSNSTPQAIAGTPSSTPVAPSTSPNATLLSWVYVGEGVTLIVSANITDKRTFLPDMDEVVTARAAYASLNARFVADESAISTVSGNLGTHTSNNITSGNTVHGIRQGAGNGLDADKLDAEHGAYYLDRANHSNTQLPATISPQGIGSGLDADKLDGYHANATPTVNAILPLDGSAKFPSTVIPNILGRSIKDSLVTEADGTSPLNKVVITAEKLSVDDIILDNVSAFADITLSGAGGLDAGGESSSTWYRVFVICNAAGTLVAGLLSTSASPVLPGGYTKYRRVGWVRNNASSNFVQSTRTGSTIIYTDPTAYNQSGPSGVTSFSVELPPTCRMALGWGQFSGSGLIQYRLPGTSMAPISLGFTNGPTTIYCQYQFLVNSSQQVDFSVVAGSNFVTVYGYIDEV